MNQKYQTITNLLPFFFLLLGGLFFSTAQEAVPFAPRLAGGNMEIRGDIIFVGNNILNRATEANPGEANTGYSGTTDNNSLWMEYIDIDGDPTTFSSSSASLALNDVACSQVRYAGLYWAATYPNERSTNSGAPFTGTPRIEDWNQIKFKVPGGNYVNLSADTAADPVGEEDDIIFDGYNYTNINNSFKDSPYICYKNVTDLVRANTNPVGEYTVANMRATKGRREGSSSAGWVMVVIYENPTETGKFISTFDGYAGMSSSAGSVDVDVNGFKTLPTGFPVRARVGVGALEGDRGINNDRFSIKANSNGTYSTLSNTLNPADNFFNSTITTNAAQVTTRNPYGTNSLGLDLDIYNINNPTNSVLPNNETGATLRFTSTGDGYGSFLATFSVEIIEPEIILEKRVEDIAGNDITGLGVNLGQTLDYVLYFKNVGNDDAANYTIRDVLPVNTTFISTDFSNAPGVTASAIGSNNEITFTIPDNLVELGDPQYSIRMRVKVAENCFDFVDACSGTIQNVAFSTYRGEINSNQITDDPSVSDFNDCGFTTPGATNFLLDDLEDCFFARTVQLCGDNVLLSAGEGFDEYIWYRDVNGNNTIDIGTDVVLTDANTDGDAGTLLVTDIGTYIVDKKVADPCKGFQEIITVERFGTTQTNPIIDFFNNSNSDADLSNDIQGEIATCSIDKSQLPKIFLCGVGDSQTITVNINDAQTLVWEKLLEGSCTDAGDDCANKNSTCTWTQVGTGTAFTATEEGKYRLVINYQNGCSSRFYFNVFQNNLDLQYNSSDIICATPGNITISNLGSSYGYQLYDITDNSIEVPYSANNGPSFTISSNGAYRVGVMQLDGNGIPIDGACEFTTPDIGIRERDFQVELSTAPANCNELGSIGIQVLNVPANYSYEIRLNDGTPAPAVGAPGYYPEHPGGTLQNLQAAQTDNNYTFSNLNPGDYFIVTRTDDLCLDVQSITVGEVPDLSLQALTLANIGCDDGSVQLTPTGGFADPDYNFAIWSKNGVALYPSGITSIPANAYQVDTIFNFATGEQGDYEFVVVDSNNCFSISNQITILDNGIMTASVPTEQDVSCSGADDGAISIVAVNGVAPYSYSINGGSNFQTTPNFVGLAPGNYNVVVQDSSGCEVTFAHTIEQPFPLSASAGISRDVTCDPNGAEVRVTNVVGGNAPYEYSFNGGATYGPASTATLLPGNYSVVVRDAGGCEHAMGVTVEEAPETPVITADLDYNCDGSGNVTLTSNVSTYDYTYELNGIPNSPDAGSNVFSNLTTGTYTLTTNYISQTPPTPSILLTEDFGSGGTIASPNTVGYTYEPQDGTNGSTNINDFEYAVTSSIVNPFNTWINPRNHTDISDLQGRYLVINVGTPSPGQVIYTKTINDIIPNQDLRVSLWIINLLRAGQGGLDPDLTIEIREMGTGTVVQSINTGDIAKNTGRDNWIPFTADLNPGNNTQLEFVIRTIKVGNGGNDLAIDDIQVFQVPEVCELSVDTTVIIEGNREFEAAYIASTNASCNGAADGTITFEVSNFDPAQGFEYSIDGGAYITSTNASVTTAESLGAGSHTIDIRRVDDTSCTVQLIRTITEPTAIQATASVTTQFTCDTSGATITASATGGVPGYEYRLEDDLGNVISPYQVGTTFTNITQGNYIVRAKDSSDCEDTIDAAIIITEPSALSFVADPTACYSGDNDGSITVTVTGGNGGLMFSLDGGTYVAPNPTTSNTYTFDNLGAGSYMVDVRDQFGCTAGSQTIKITPSLALTAAASPITACATSTDVTITASGGDGNFVYAIVADGAVPTSFAATNPISVSAAGNYDVYVRDHNGNTDYCEAKYDLTIVKNDPLALAITNSPILCSGEAQASITIGVSGGMAPYSYSLNNGTTYQTSNTFVNRAAGTYQVRVRDANNCIVAQTYIITEPYSLSASAGVTELVECNPTDGAEVRITNAQGGTAPYTYSFDGGNTYVSSPINNLLAGTHTLFIKDANNCTFPMQVTVDPQPTPPSVSTAIDYECDGDGIVTVTADNTDYNYTYSLDGVPNSPDTSNIFENISPGAHTLTVRYINSTPPAESKLLTETFGQGPSTSITEVDPNYCFEPQIGGPSGCANGGFIDDGEYSVTNNINPKQGSWVVPNDHSGLPNGRFLVMNVGGVVGPNGIIYAKRNIEVLPNRDITISLEAFNLLIVGDGGADPDINIQLVDAGGNVIASTTTGAIPKNNNKDDWQNYTVTLNPGANANLDIVIRTNNAVTGGNDIAIDDIEAFQVPLACEAEVTENIFIEHGMAFGAGVISATDVSCNGLTDASITFEVENFDSVAGFEYSVDGGTNWILSTSSPVTTANVFGAGSQDIFVRKADDTSCALTINRLIVQPDPIVAAATITDAFTCNNTGATITASATGGNPTYQYQLEDTAGTVIRAYQTGTTFTNVPAGNYIIRARDSKLCNDHIDAPITVEEPAIPTFTTTATACYSGNNDGSIVVNVTDGNGGYLFRIDNGVWLTPGPSTPTTYTFANLANGSYTIDVMDAYGCDAVQEIVTLQPQLRGTSTLVNDLTCVSDASISINAIGGSGTYTYEWGSSASGPWNTSGISGSNFATDTDGTYFFRITDSTLPVACSFVTNSVVISPTVNPVITSITPDHLNCNGDNSGALDIVIDTNFGRGPYSIEVINTTTSQNYGTQTSGLAAGDYEVTVTDDKGCTVVGNASITQPDVITYTITSDPITCDISGGVINPGSITVSGTAGGTAEYTYHLSANNGLAPQQHTTTASDRDHTFEILYFGIYQIDVVDANGCSSFSTEIIASPPDNLDIDVSTATSDCLSGGTAYVEVSSIVGVGDYQFAILESFSPPYSTNYIGPDDPGGSVVRFTGLTPGITYTFVVYDRTTMCYYFETAAAPINTPSNMTTSLDNVANVGCTGSADGNISFTFDNYDASATAVSYEIFNSQSNISTGFSGSSPVNPPTGPITISDFATLPPGEYYLLLSEIDGPFNGCSVFGGEFTIRESINLLELELDITKNDNCNPDAGVITATGKFGTAPYEYLFLPGGATPSPTWAGSSNNVHTAEGGNYDVYIRDSYGCIQMESIFLPTDIRPEITISLVDECVPEGEYEVLVTLDDAGISPYQISVNGAAYQNITFNGSGQYTVTGLSSGLGQTIAVRDLNGCADTVPFDIYPKIQATATPTKLLDCSITPNAEITIGASSGSGSFDYSISGPVNQIRTAIPSPANSLVWDLASIAGTYIVSVYDNNTPSCDPIDFTIEVPAALLPEFTATPVDVICFGDANGSISLTQTDNGISPLSYTLSPMPLGAVLNGNTFENLPADTYTVTATGTNGCSTSRTDIVVGSPDAITGVTANVIQFGCSEGNNPDNAQISISGILGGSGTYVRYEFINDDLGATGTTVQDGSSPIYIESNPAGGNYTINVYDNKGCVGSTTAVIAPYDALVSATAAVTTMISCDPGDDGVITLSVTSTIEDGSNLDDGSKYEYSIDNGTTYQDLNEFTVGIGTYNFLVRHKETGCTIPAKAKIDDPNTFEVIVTKNSDVVCYGTETGEVVFSLTDPTYTASVNWIIWNTNGTADTADDTFVKDGTFATPGPTVPAISLFAGSYLVQIIQNDHPACTNFQAFTIAGPTAAITAQTTVTDITCNPTDNGVVEIINADGGWGGYSYYVGTTAPSSVADYMASPSFENLVAGTYQAWVRDANGCEEMVDTDIELETPTPITADLQINVENCTNFEGEIEVVNTAGGQDGNYTYQLQRYNTGTASFEDVGASRSTPIFGGLSAGEYQVVITDQWGCSATTANTVELYEEMQPLATIVKDIDCSVDPGGRITISQTGGSGTYVYNGTFPNGTALPTNTDGAFTGLDQVGEYTFTITDGDCMETIKKSLEPRVIPVPTLEAFTDVTCFGNNDGTINVSTLDNGVGPYTFQITDMDGTVVAINPTSSTNTTAEFTGLANTVGAGYTITVRGVNECAATLLQAIGQPAAPLSVPDPTPVAFECATGNTTEYPIIDITGVTGGSGIYVRYVFVNNTTGTTVQDGSNSSYTETDLAGGVYEITVYDDKGCTDTATATIIPFVGIANPTVSIIDGVTCNTNDEVIKVTVDISPATATPTLEYHMEGLNVAYDQTNATGDFSGLGVGNYVVTVTNLDTGCFVQTAHSIAEPKIIEAIATKITDETCLNDVVDAGSISVAINNYSGGYDYQVYQVLGSGNVPLAGPGFSGSDSVNPLIISDLTGGSYYVQITETDPNSTFCTDDSNAVTILAPSAPISAVVREEANVSCDNDKGKILVDPSGGQAPYTITITSATQSFTQTGVGAYIFTDLSAGNFDITITDALGCITTDYSLELVRPVPIVANISPDIMLDCVGDSNGTLSATITAGGLGTLRYHLNIYDETGTNILQTSVGQPTNNTFGNLPAGKYSISIYDEVGCSGETPIATIEDPVDVSGSLIMTQALTCENDLELLLTANGGTAPYSYSANGTDFLPFNNGDQHIFNTLPSGNSGAGTYRYYVRDSFGCTSILSNEIRQEPVAPLTVSIDETAAIINCNGESTATIRATAAGGLGNYRYELFTDLALSDRIAGPQATRNFNGLAAGEYYVRVISEDCSVVSPVIIIEEPDPLTYTDDYGDVTCNGEDNGFIRVELGGGSGGYQYAISPNLNQFSSDNTFDNLAPGQYTVIAQDRNGCFELLEYTIAEPEVITIEPTILPEICAGSADGSVTISISGGTGPYTTAFNSNDPNDFVAGQMTFTDLAAGTYVIFVKDAQGCEANIVFEVEPGVNIDAVVTPVYECTEELPVASIVVALADPSVASDVLYAMDSTDPADMVLEPDFTNLEAGPHYLTISHANGCLRTIDFEIEGFEPLTLQLESRTINQITALAAGGNGAYTYYFGDVDNGEENTFFIHRTDTYTVRVVDENGCEVEQQIFMEFIDLEIPNFFTPDGDGQNDFWKPRNQEAWPGIITIIFDRYGREVYRMGINDVGWDGLYQNTELPTGDYWYVIKLNGESDDREFVGHFTLYR
ncbi:MAG: T9SS type B sorting domain-containing protein [Sediminicola sp.]